MVGLENGEIYFFLKGQKVKHIKEVSSCGIKAITSYQNFAHLVVVDENSRLLMASRTGSSLENSKFKFEQVGMVSTSFFIKM